MSRLYDSVEPSVIDDEMLRTATEEQGPKHEAGTIAKSKGIDFADVRQLRLDFKNILKIDNLWCFTCLTKLQLDNNIIEKINGLQSLVHLVWLDLSFNNIEEISGIDTLVKLQDLTLFNNRITRIENMDTLAELEVLSLGNNEISDLDMIKYLRRFKKLKVVNLNGNPFCEQDNYKAFVVAYLSWVDYLDYAMIKEEFRNKSIESYQIALDELSEKEKEEAVMNQKKKEKDDNYQRHKEAYVEGLNDDTLFKDMYADDVEGKKLDEMPGVTVEVYNFKEKLMDLCQQVFDYGIEEHQNIMDEVNTFWECVEEAKQENKNAAVEEISDFIIHKDKVTEELNEITDENIFDTKVSEYNTKVDEIRDKLLMYEIQLVDQLEDVIKDFDRNLQDMVGTFIEGVQCIFSQCRDLENLHHEKIMEIALVQLEKSNKNELDFDLSDDLRNILVDKDTVVNALTSSHEVHLQKIDNREDQIISRIRHWMKTLIKKIHEEEEVQRNRQRVIEINNLMDHFREQVENFDTMPGV